MLDNETADYIRSLRQTGKKDTEIISGLVTSGWTEQQATAAVSQYELDKAPVPDPPLKPVSPANSVVSQAMNISIRTDPAQTPAKPGVIIVTATLYWTVAGMAFFSSFFVIYVFQEINTMLANAGVYAPEYAFLEGIPAAPAILFGSSFLNVGLLYPAFKLKTGSAQAWKTAFIMLIAVTAIQFLGGVWIGLLIQNVVKGGI